MQVFTIFKLNSVISNTYLLYIGQRPSSIRYRHQTNPCRLTTTQEEVLYLAVLCRSVLVWLWRNSPIVCWGRGRTGPGYETAVRRTCGWPGRRCSRAGRRATAWGPCGRARCGCWPDPLQWGWWDVDCVSSCHRCCPTAGDCCWRHGSSAYL